MIFMVSLLLVFTMYLLITEKVRLDITSLGVLVVIMVTGLLTPAETLSAFSNTAVITVAAMFMISRGLMRTGALGFISERIIRYSQGNLKKILLAVLFLAAIPSAFINNTPVVVLLVTIIMSVCCEYSLSPSKLLIPVSYSAILGGTCTLIGTSTNLVVSDLSARLGYGTLGMFELVPVGVPIALASFIMIYFAAPRFLPGMKAPVCDLSEKNVPHYLAEVRVPAASRIVGHDPRSYFASRYPNIELFEVIRDGRIHLPEREPIRIEGGECLLLKGSASDLIAILDKKVVELPHRMEEFEFKAGHESFLFVELIIPPISRYLGEHPIESVQKRLGIQIVAIKRQGMHYTEQKLENLKLSIGDTLLVYCSAENLANIRNSADIIILEEVHNLIMNRKKAPLALAIFFGMVVAATAGLTDITVASLTAVFAMLVTGCLQMRDAYRSVDVQILLVIIATIVLGVAMQKVGADRYYADLFLTPFHGQHPTVVLAAFILLTIFLTEAMSNNATAVLLLPIAISTALSIGVSPKPFIIGVCLGSSYGFAIPAGYQTHMLVFGSGGYRFSDFFKLGIPLDLLAWIMSFLLIPVFWPF